MLPRQLSRGVKVFASTFKAYVQQPQKKLELGKYELLCTETLLSAIGLKIDFEEDIKMDINALLTGFVKKGVSDIHLHTNMPPMGRSSGKLIASSETKLAPEELNGLIDIMCNEDQKGTFREERQVDVAYTVSGLARFRVNLFMQQDTLSAVLRVINSDESQLQLVNLPDKIIELLRDQEKGLVLVTGPTGSGKSTTMARVLDEINKIHQKMIVTVEDPIEYVHTPKKSVIVQRELNKDVMSFSKALRAAMRQDPDVIMIGEIRDYATAAAAIEAAQTGHLVLSTLHTLDTVRTVNRILDLFPPHERETARVLFAESMVAIISQKLLPKPKKGRVAAMEILLGNLRVRDLIRDAERTHEIYDAIRDSRIYGMQLFDDVLVDLYAKGLIDYEVGLSAATSNQSFKMAATQVEAKRQEELKALEAKAASEAVTKEASTNIKEQDKDTSKKSSIFSSTDDNFLLPDFDETRNKT